MSKHEDNLKAVRDLFQRMEESHEMPYGIMGYEIIIKAINDSSNEYESLRHDILMLRDEMKTNLDKPVGYYAMKLTEILDKIYLS